MNHLSNNNSDAPIHNSGCPTWELIMPIEGTGISSGVSAVEFKGKLYAFYTRHKTPDAVTLGYVVLNKNADNDLRLESINELPAPQVAHFRPAVTVYAQHLYCFYTATDQTIRLLNYSGAEWSSTESVPNVLTSDAPSVASNGASLYLALRSTRQHAFYHKVLDHTGWQPHVLDPDIDTAESPSLCIYENVPYVGIRTPAEQQLICRLSSYWHPIHLSKQRGTYGAPALAAHDKCFFSAARLRDSNQCTIDRFQPKQGMEHVDKTAGAYLSPPCLTQYSGDLYLISQRPCNDLAILKFNPD